MNKLKILIIEDDPGSMLTLESAVHELGYLDILTTDNSESALEIIENERPDLLLLDIEINGKLSGTEVALKVQHLEIPIIFITGIETPEMYKKAKSIGPNAYLLKPFSLFTLETAIDNVIKSMQFEPKDTVESEEETILKDSLFVKNGSMLQKVRFSEIKWVESEGNYCTLVTDSKKYAIRISLSRLIKRLPSETFTRIHKSYLVQTGLIVRIDTHKGKVYIDKECLPLGRTYKDSLLYKLNRI